jgi:hypothetical protein
MDFPRELTPKDSVGFDASGERLERQMERLGTIGRRKLSKKAGDTKLSRCMELIWAHSATYLHQIHHAAGR